MRNILYNLAGLVILLTLIGCAAKKELESPVEETDMVLPPSDYYLWVIKPNINIRQENSARSEKVGELADGDSVIVRINDNGWYNIETTSGAAGWVRSDLLAPKNVSIFRKAVIFADKLKEEQDIDLLFDKKLQHARVYLSLPPGMYTSADIVETRAREIITAYQRQVYRGDVAVRVLKPGSDKEYITFDQNGKPNPETPIPVIPFGRLETVNDLNPDEIELAVLVKSEIDNERLLNAARNMVKTYPISYRKVTIKFISSEDKCRLWFTEDPQGELYEFDKCPE